MYGQYGHNLVCGLCPNEVKGLDVGIVRVSVVRTLLSVCKVLEQKDSSDRWLPSDTSKYPTSTINHPSTTMPPQKTGYLSEFEKGQIVALRKKEISFSEIRELLHCPKSTVQTFHNHFQKRGDPKTIPI